MKLKKINEKLQDALIENGLTEANALQQETFSTIKSGADCLIVSPEGSGKTTTTGKLGNLVNTANPHWFSYPGYSEIMTGYPDPAINSNSYEPNPHVSLHRNTVQWFPLSYLYPKGK